MEQKGWNRSMCLECRKQGPRGKGSGEPQRYPKARAFEELTNDHRISNTLTFKVSLGAPRHRKHMTPPPFELR
jgi:hypothetical protein